MTGETHSAADCDHDPVRILLVSGSSRKGSHTAALTALLAERLENRGVATTHWDLVERPLSPPEPVFHNDPTHNPDPTVHELVSLAAAADGFVLGSPVYHNSYSATLKVALDHLAITQFMYKPVSLVSHGGRRGTQAVDHLRQVVRGLLGIALPAQVCTDDTDYEERDEGLVLCSATIRARIDRTAAELAQFAWHLRLIRQPGHR